MKKNIIVLAHNIRSLWNVGALFRSADCFSVERLILSGYSPTPPRREISKTALGAEEWVPWEYRKSAIDVVQEFAKAKRQIVALESCEGSVPIRTAEIHQDILLIIGHEVTGVPRELLELSDTIVHIAMHGKKESLNVSVATGIALDQLQNG